MNTVMRSTCLLWSALICAAVLRAQPQARGPEEHVPQCVLQAPGQRQLSEDRLTEYSRAIARDAFFEAVVRTCGTITPLSEKTIENLRKRGVAAGKLEVLTKLVHDNQKLEDAEPLAKRPAASGMPENRAVGFPTFWFCLQDQTSYEMRIDVEDAVKHLYRIYLVQVETRSPVKYAANADLLITFDEAGVGHESPTKHKNKYQQALFLKQGFARALQRQFPGVPGYRASFELKPYTHEVTVRQFTAQRIELWIEGTTIDKRWVWIPWR